MRTKERRTEELLALGVFGRGPRLGERIELLLKRGREFSPRASLRRVAGSVVALLGLLCAGSLAPRWFAFAQQSPRPVFEVASVRPTAPESPLNAPGAGVPVRKLNAGNLTYSNVTLIEYVEFAYGLETYQISQPYPKALLEMYDISAKAGSPLPDRQTKLMLQTLLEDRFKLRFHRLTKELPVYALTAGKNGPKFGPGADDGKSGVTGVSGNAIRWHNTSMADLAGWISKLPSLGRPVLDRTGLPGAYDFTLTIEGLPNKSADSSSKIGLKDALDASIFGSMQDLGLKLESDKAPIEFMVIDHVERPDAN